MARYSVAAEVLKRYERKHVIDIHSQNLKELESKIAQEQNKVHIVGNAKITFYREFPTQEQENEIQSELSLPFERTSTNKEEEEKYRMLGSSDLYIERKKLPDISGSYLDDPNKDLVSLYHPFDKVLFWKHRSKTPLMDIRTWHTTVYLDFGKNKKKKK